MDFLSVLGFFLKLVLLSFCFALDYSDFSAVGLTVRHLHICKGNISIAFVIASFFFFFCCCFLCVVFLRFVLFLYYCCFVVVFCFSFVECNSFLCVLGGWMGGQLSPGTSIAQGIIVLPHPQPPPRTTPLSPFKNRMVAPLRANCVFYSGSIIFG